jgi:hypothetical protein
MLKHLGRFLSRSVYIVLVIILVYYYMKDVEYALMCRKMLWPMKLLNLVVFDIFFS